MSYKVLTIPPFDKQLKRLSKKYQSLKEEYLRLIESLELNPIHGDSLGNNCFKIRLAIASKKKEKSGGARIITHIIVIQKIVYLLAIYDKSEQSSLSGKDLKRLIKNI
jgi:mRNA-degrading endonuclease RelE of RelBE toxin-antitoxin system